MIFLCNIDLILGARGVGCRVIAAAELGDKFNISDFFFSYLPLCSDDTSSNGSNSDRDSGIETGNSRGWHWWKYLPAPESIEV